jgi:hypothetical protein
MQHCVEIAEDFQSGTPGAYFTFSDQGLNLLKVSEQNKE